MLMDVILIFIVTVLGYLWITRKPKGYPPGPTIVPIIGSIKPFAGRTSVLEAMDALKEKYGPVVGIKVGTRRIVFVVDPKYVMEALKRDEFQGRPKIVRNQKANPGIVFTEGQFWSEQRRFTLRHLRDFGFGKTSTEDMILSEADEFFECNFNKETPILIDDQFNTSSINILWAMMSGHRFSYNDPKFNVLLEAIEKSFTSVSRQLGFLKTLKIVQKLFPVYAGVFEKEEAERMLKDFFVESIKDHKETMTGDPRDLTDVYLTEIEKPDSPASFSETTMIAIYTDLFTAGAQSIGYTLAFLVLYLVNYPEWQQKVFEQIDLVLGKERRPTLADRKTLPLVDAFMSEASRLNPIAPINAPRRSVVDTHLAGHFIPEDTSLFLSLKTILDDKEHWGDPENFRPERFLKEDGSYLNDEWLLLFGGGKRVCIGEILTKQMTFLFFVYLVQQYKISLPEGEPKPSTVPLSAGTSRPRPFKVIVTKRS